MTKQELDHRRYLEIKGTAEYKERNARGSRKWTQAHGERARKLKSEWHRHHKDESRENRRERNLDIKIEVLSHYGPDGRLQCSWPDCGVTDIDMLSLDHVNNDGAQDRKSERRGGGGNTTYHRVRKAGYPDGFQTLCHNHQWKKELMRRRDR